MSYSKGEGYGPQHHKVCGLFDADVYYLAWTMAGVVCLAAAFIALIVSYLIYFGVDFAGAFNTLDNGAGGVFLVWFYLDLAILLFVLITGVTAVCTFVCDGHAGNTLLCYMCWLCIFLCSGLVLSLMFLLDTAGAIDIGTGNVTAQTGSYQVDFEDPGFEWASLILALLLNVCCLCGCITCAWCLQHHGHHGKPYTSRFQAVHHHHTTRLFGSSGPGGHYPTRAHHYTAKKVSGSSSHAQHHNHHRHQPPHHKGHHAPHMANKDPHKRYKGSGQRHEKHAHHQPYPQPHHAGQGHPGHYGRAPPPRRQQPRYAHPPPHHHSGGGSGGSGGPPQDHQNHHHQQPRPAHQNQPAQPRRARSHYPIHPRRDPATTSAGSAGSAGGGGAGYTNTATMPTNRSRTTGYYHRSDVSGPSSSRSRTSRSQTRSRSRGRSVSSSASTTGSLSTLTSSSYDGGCSFNLDMPRDVADNQHYKPIYEW